MRGIRIRSTITSIVAILCAVFFLAMSIGNVSRAVAAETWETWPPKKTSEPGAQPGAADAGNEAGKNTAMGLSYGTIGWIAAGTAAVIVIAIAAGGSSSSSSSPACNQ